MSGRKEKSTKNIVEYKVCTSCGINKDLKRQYYISNSPYKSDKRENICKDCLKKNIKYDDLSTIKSVLQEINRPFIYSLWLSAVEEANSKSTMSNDPLGCYMKSLFLNYKDLTWKDSDDSDPNKDTLSLTINDDASPTPIVTSLNFSFDEQNKQDVLRMVGYDPFEFENESDKRHLYNKLVDFLDESTLEDSFKLPAVIEIVKTFNQIDKINSAISIITANTKALAENIGGVKTLTEAKEKMLKSVLALAKDNGISVNHNNNKSKGTGTLSGIIKQLQEKGVESADVNLYDIETCEGMKQVADISNKSIFEQLMLNENDYTEMIKEQREMIERLTSKSEKLEEENRLLKIRIKSLEMQDKNRIQLIEGNESKDE